MALNFKEKFVSAILVGFFVIFYLGNTIKEEDTKKVINLNNKEYLAHSRYNIFDKIFGNKYYSFVSPIGDFNTPRDLNMPINEAYSVRETNNGLELLFYKRFINEELDKVVKHESDLEYTARQDTSEMLVREFKNAR